MRFKQYCKYPYEKLILYFNLFEGSKVLILLGDLESFLLLSISSSQSRFQSEVILSILQIILSKIKIIPCYEVFVVCLTYLQDSDSKDPESQLFYFYFSKLFCQTIERVSGLEMMKLFQGISFERNLEFKMILY